jgi:hypothetical protein
MRLSNKERLLLEKINKKYGKLITKNVYDIYPRISCAIQVIECQNRNIIWRLLEYLIISINSIKYIFTEKIDNMSIGIMQLKVSFILDYLGINYLLEKRTIKIPGSKFFPLKMIFANRNNKNVLYNLMSKEEYLFIENNSINKDKFKYFIEEYSRTLSSDVGFTYYFICSSLLGII